MKELETRQCYDKEKNSYSLEQIIYLVCFFYKIEEHQLRKKPKNDFMQRYEL